MFPTLAGSVDGTLPGVPPPTKGWAANMLLGPLLNARLAEALLNVPSLTGLASMDDLYPHHREVTRKRDPRPFKNFNKMRWHQWQPGMVEWPSNDLNPPNFYVYTFLATTAVHRTQKWRQTRNPAQKELWEAVAAASRKRRGIQRAQLKKRKAKSVGRPLKISFKPENWEALVSQIPAEDRLKPTRKGQKVVYVPHERWACNWTTAKVVQITKAYKGTSWVVVQPGGEDKCLAIASENVFLLK